MHGNALPCANQSEGFTLVELLIVVAIVAILAAIAMPRYTQYVQRGRLAEAATQLSTARTQLEVFFQDNRIYGTAGTGCGTPVASLNSAFFNYTCYLVNDPAATTQADNQSYVVHAVGTGSLAGFEYTIDQTGNKQTRSFVGASGLPVSCWILRAGQAC